MDDLRSKEKHPKFGTGLNGYSFIWQDEAIKRCSDDRLRDVIVDLVVPWYVNFYVSWTRLCETGAVRAKWVTYEEMMSNKRSTVEEILRFVGMPNTPNRIDQVLEMRAKTYNVGGSMRGDARLSAAQQDRIRRLFSYYPDIGFEKYGVSQGVSDSRGHSVR